MRLIHLKLFLKLWKLDSLEDTNHILDRKGVCLRYKHKNVSQSCSILSVMIFPHTCNSIHDDKTFLTFKIEYARES